VSCQTFKLRLARHSVKEAITLLRLQKVLYCTNRTYNRTLIGFESQPGNHQRVPPHHEDGHSDPPAFWLHPFPLIPDSYGICYEIIWKTSWIEGQKELKKDREKFGEKRRVSKRKWAKGGPE
jgi:hypothetical protein